MSTAPHSWDQALHELSAAACVHVEQGMTPMHIVEALLAHDLFEDALVFSAFALPPRDAIWWGCLCAWRKARPRPSGTERAAFQACLQWIQHQSEETRHTAQQASARAGLRTPAGCLAMAVFCTRGSISEPGLPTVEASPGLTPQSVVAALRVAAALENPAHMHACFRRYVRMAREPLLRLSGHAATSKGPGEALEGSIASRWSESQKSPEVPSPAAPTPPAPSVQATSSPPLHADLPHKAAHITKKAVKELKDGDDDKDAWDGLSKVEE